MALECLTWVWFTHLFFWGSILIWFAWSLFYSSFLSAGDMYWVSERLYGMGVYWWGLLLVCVLCVLPDLIYMYVQRAFFPNDEDIILEHELGYGADSSLSEITPTGQRPSSGSHVEMQRSPQLSVQMDDEKTSR
jgi:magnesium-transporting ATPase (P-type)